MRFRAWKKLASIRGCCSLKTSETSERCFSLVMKTQIVDYQMDALADFVHSCVLRVFIKGLIAAIPCVGAIHAIVDFCFIFRDDRRCIHDLLTSTVGVYIS